MERKRPKPRFGVTDLVQFKKIKRTQLAGGDFWIDIEDNLISPGTIGMIVARNWAMLEDAECWEYDVSIPDLGVISAGWGDYALSPLQKTCSKDKA